MEKVLTSIQKSYKDTPTRLDLLRELDKRNALIHHADLQKELERLERGLEGERILIEYIEKYREKSTGSFLRISGLTILVVLNAIFYY